MPLVAVALGLLALAVTPPEDAAGPRDRVVFVCEHGNVKSLIAREWFNRLAAARGLAVRAESRGLAPEDAVPKGIAGRLNEDGFDVVDFRPQALAPDDLERASRLVIIGAQPPAWTSTAGVPVERWDGVPPASERYEASRDALRERIAALLDALQVRPAP